MSTPTAVKHALAIAIQAREPVLLWGEPGGGKSRMIEGLSTQLGRSCETVVGSVREATDFAGLPMRTDEGVVFVPPRWAQRAALAGDAVVFLDELTTSTPQVQAAMLRIVLDREVGDLTLPSTVSIVAAANPPESAAGGYDLAPPLANRFCHLTWRPSARDWVDGMLQGWAPTEIPVVPEERSDHLLRWRTYVTAFITAQPNRLHILPTDIAKQGTAWPSPRTWDQAARLGAAADAAAADESVRLLLLTGCVGEGAAIEFASYLKNLDLPDPEALLADPASLVLPDRSDRAFAVLGSVVAAVAAEPTEQRWSAAWAVLRVALDAAPPDVSAGAARALAGLKAPSWKLPTDLREFLPMLRRAGIIR